MLTIILQLVRCLCKLSKTHSSFCLNTIKTNRFSAHEVVFKQKTISTISNLSKALQQNQALCYWDQVISFTRAWREKLVVG